MKCIIGIDIGTSGCKVLAIDEKGKLLTSVTNSYPCYAPFVGWSEQVPEDWWEATVKGIKEVVSQIGGRNVCSIGLSGQMHGMVALDSSDNTVRPAILWNDQRTKKQCDFIVDRAGGTDGLLKLTNNPLLTGFTAGKILWMKENEPENYNKTQLILNPKDYIRFRMTGAKLTEVSDASGTGLFDVKNRRWCKELIEKIGLSITLFPEVCESSEICAEVTDEIAALTGLPENCPVAGGGGDAVLSTIGMGLGDSDKIAIMLGTSGVVSMHTDKFFENKGAKLQFSCACIPDCYHIMGVTLAAAGSYSWFCNTFGDYEAAQAQENGQSVFRQLDALAEKSPAGANGIIYLPYLQGERCPINDEKAKSCFFGASAQSTKADFTRAVLEGVAFSLRQVYDLIKGSAGLDPSGIVLAGGGAKSPLWRQIFADVFNLPVLTLAGCSEGSGFGAALVAGVGAGVFKSVNEPLSALETSSVQNPIAENAAVCETSYKKYCKLYPALKDI